MTAERGRVEFRHRLLSDEYGYDYRKTLRLTDAPGLRIEYTLKNLGPAPLTGHVYNHNFLRRTPWPQAPTPRSISRSAPGERGARLTTAWR